jgi:hypothetical protein
MNKPMNWIVVALLAVCVSPVASAQTNDSTVTPTHADKKAAKQQAKADKKSDVAQAKADKSKTEAQSDADKAAADAREKDAKKE